MPKFNTSAELFYSLLGERPSRSELEELLPVAKAELDEYDDALGGGGDIKIELNDTNRPDLWSAAGLTRQLRSYRGHQHNYPFFSTRGAQQECGERQVIVDKNIRGIRPYICAFEVRGKPLTDAQLVEMIDIQERLCDAYGRKRQSVAMGIYRADILQYPIRYYGADPDKTSFAPLGDTRDMSLRKILQEHPKGREYGGIISDNSLYPLIVDNNKDVLSMPPIINSARLGAVQVGDSTLFVELTGDNPELVYTAGNIVACDFADYGYEILPVGITYPYETEFGSTHCTPYNFHTPVSVDMGGVGKRLGTEIDTADALHSLQKIGVTAVAQKSGQGTAGDVPTGASLSATLPPWRNDYMHEVDVCEDIMIGIGLEKFTPQTMTDFTIGKLLPVEMLSRKVVSILVGLGFQEMINHYLVNSSEWIENMYPEQEHKEANTALLRIANPRSEQHDSLRNSIIPSLLRVERASAHAVLPHKIFEVGKIAVVDKKQSYGSRTTTAAAFLAASNSENFTAANDRLSALLYYLNIPYTLQESTDSRFIAGRQAHIIVDTQQVGIIGELHPRVLDSWNIQTPISCCELDIEQACAAFLGNSDGSTG